MNLTDSILDNMFGATFSPPDSPERKDWLSANERLIRETEPELRRRIESKGIRDPYVLEVLSVTWIDFRKSPTVRTAVGEKDSRRSEIARNMMITICHHRINDFFQRMRQRQRTHVSLDAPINGENGDTYLDRYWVTSANDMLASWHTAETTDSLPTVEKIIDGLVAKGIITAKQLGIFLDKLEGKSAREIADANDSTEGSVNDLYWRILERLRRAIFVLRQGKALEQAIVAAAQNQHKSKKND